MRFFIFVLGVLVSVPAPSIAAAEAKDHATALGVCLDEARWPVESSAAYRNGSARTREMLRNADTNPVLQTRAICRALASNQSSRADHLSACQQAVAADAQSASPARRAHASRQAAACQAISHGI